MLLFNPINLLNLSTLTSTYLYMREIILPVLSECILRYAYLFPHIKPKSIDFREIFLRTNAVFVIAGYLLIPVYIYNVLHHNQMKLLWGGFFKVAEIYALFSITSLALGLYTRKGFYFISTLIFFIIFLHPARRSETIGILITFTLIIGVYIWHNRSFLKHGLITLLAILITTSGGVLYFIHVKKDPRLVTAYRVIKGEIPLDDNALNRFSLWRWANLKAAIVVIRKDIENMNLVPILFGHGIYGGRKLNPPPPNGLPYYESIVFVQEYIQRGLLGLLAILVIYYRSIKLLLRIDLSRRENVLAIPFGAYLVFYNLGMLFRPYVDGILPLALLMFGVYEVYLRSAQERRK